MIHSVNSSINDEGVYRTAPATPDLLIIGKNKVNKREERRTKGM